MTVTLTQPIFSWTARERAALCWNEMSLGNIARPANADEAVKFMTPHFERAMADAKERVRLPATREGLTHHFTITTKKPSAEAAAKAQALEAAACVADRWSAEAACAIRALATDVDEVEDIKGYIQTGVYEGDSRLGEIFLKLGKSGDTSAWLDQFATLFSIAIQYGAPFDVLARKFVGTRFEPAGPTKNKDVPRCTSLLDYVARFLLLHYGAKEEVQP